MEKVLSLDVDAYTFEVIFSVGYMWLEDRVYNLPEATPQEMEDCPEVSKCGFCDFRTGRTCHVRNANGFTNPRTGKAAGVNKCCKDLWNPLMSEGLPWDGVIWPNAKETEILYQDGPTYTDVCRQKITGTSEYLDRLCIANYNTRFPATSEAARSPAAGRRGGKKAAGDADTAKKAKTSGKTATGRARRGVGGEEDAGRPKRRVGGARDKQNLRAKSSGKTAWRRVRRVELPCVDLPGFEDSAGDTCEVWAANPTWCDGWWDPEDGDIGPPADYANADGIDPGTACCVCQNQNGNSANGTSGDAGTSGTTGGTTTGGATDDAGLNITNKTSGDARGNGTVGGAGGNESAVADGAAGNETANQTGNSANWTVGGASGNGAASNQTENNTDSNAPPSGTPALTLQISMPYTLVEFEKEKQAFKEAVAAAAGVDVRKVWINATELSARRRLLENGIVVETRIYGGSAAVITKTLGTGDELLTKLNAELTRFGLRASSGVTSAEGLCVDLPGFVDSEGDTCEKWAANPTWCDGWDPKDGDIGPPADYANADGIDPGTACCVCQNQSRSEDKEGQDNEDEGWISASGHRNWDMDGPSVAFAEVRMRGVFYIPMDFQVFPTDTQVLDIHMSTKAYTWQFNLSNISHNGNATGDYVAGGPDMPVAEKKRLGLDANPRCPRHPSTAESENNSSMTYFEDLSGWSISKNVQVLRFQADDQNCLTSSPCNASRPSKFSLQHELNVMRNIPFNTPLSAEERESQQRSFIVFRMTVCRRTTYYVENVLTVIILLNIINVLSLLLSPEDVETRLGSCGTMVLALAALQAFVTSSVPSVGYSTHGQAFVQISNILMIAAALESVLVYQGCKQRFCLLRLLRFDPEGDLALSEMLVWDHMFIIFYCMLLVYYVDKYFRDAMEGLFVPGLTVCIVALLLVLIFHFFRLGQELLRLKQSNSGAGKTKDSTTERKSETAKRIEICFASRPELLQYSQMFDDHVIAPSQLKDLTVEELSQVMKIPLGHAKSMPALFQACHHTELAGDAMEKCVQSPDLTQSNTESMTPERDMRVMDRDASLMTTAAAGAGERPAFEESETTLASETHSTVRDGIV